MKEISRKKLIKIKQEEYQMISLLLLYCILMSILTILSFGVIGVLLIFFKDNSYILITGTFLVLFFVSYKLNKFKELF